jgi:hypothetical protein
MTASRSVRSAGFVVLALWLVFGVVAPAGPAAALPDKLSDADYWKIVTDFSEPGGYFRITDNFTSNEREVGAVFSMLRATSVRGGVYLGVGPEQNFSYIAAIRPAMAFIVDIRRQAVMQHLMFKAVFELAKDRADFIALLFSKVRPDGLDTSTPIQRIWDAFRIAPSDAEAGTKTYTRIVDQLTKTHGFTFTEDESEQLKLVYQAFRDYGPEISTRGGGARGTITFADLTGWSVDAGGQPQSFLSTDEHYRTVKTLHEKNLIVPLSGDFGGPKAIRAVGAYLKKQGGAVSAFYVSNVEQYLFQDGKATAFYENVATLPLTEASVFIRPYSMRRAGSETQSLCAIGPFVAAASAGKIYSNNDALACVR